MDGTGGCRMEDELTRAQHYRLLALQMRDTAGREKDGIRRSELVELATQYESLADKLVHRHVSREGA